MALGLLVCLALGGWAVRLPTQPTPPPVSSPITSLEEAIVRLTTGQAITGLLVEQTAEHIVLRMSGVERSPPAAKVEGVTILPPIIDRYRDMRAHIDPNDVPSLVQLALWLEARERYDLAIAEVDRALDAEPTDRQARVLRNRLCAKQELARAMRDRHASAPEKPATAPDPTSTEPPQDLRLTAEQVNLIRVFEVDLANPPRMAISRDVIDRFIDAYKDDPRFPAAPDERKALYTADPVDVLTLMFTLRARDFYDDVQVLDDPASMKLFRERIHRPLLMNSCATSACHGGDRAGRFHLIRDRMFSDRTVYTNFLIVDRFRLDDGTPLINYKEPRQSPLLQMAFARDTSTHPHPPVPGQNRWYALIRSENDRRIADFVQWVNLMYEPHPDYSVDLPTPAEPAPGPPR